MNRRFDKAYCDYSDDELRDEALNIHASIRAKLESLRHERALLKDLQADMNLVFGEMQRRVSGVLEQPEIAPRQCFHCAIKAGRGVSLQPVEGLEGQFECRNTAACEERLLTAAP